MTVIVTRNSRMVAYIKGADTSIIPKCEAPDESIIKRGDQLAKDGLRVLLFAKKELRSLDDNLDTGFTMLGCTAVEDLLQEDVKGCLEDFGKANIKVWMLTGDNGYTARTVAFNCGIA